MRRSTPRTRTPMRSIGAGREGRAPAAAAGSGLQAACARQPERRGGSLPSALLPPRPAGRPRDDRPRARGACPPADDSPGWRVVMTAIPPRSCSFPVFNRRAPRSGVPRQQLRRNHEGAPRSESGGKVFHHEDTKGTKKGDRAKREENTFVSSWFKRSSIHQAGTQEEEFSPRRARRPRRCSPRASRDHPSSCSSCPSWFKRSSKPVVGPVS